MQTISQNLVQKRVSREMSRISRRLKQRLITFEIAENSLVESRVVSSTSLKYALQRSPKLSISTMILLENVTGGCLYLKFVPIRAGASSYCLRLVNPSRDALARIFANFFKTMMLEKDSTRLALRSGLSCTTIKNLKNETHLPNLKTIFKMARALGYDAYLLTMEKTLFTL